MQNANAGVRFPERFRLRGPRGLCAALDAAAERHHTSPSEWARQVILRGLEAEGVQLSHAKGHNEFEEKNA
jgi:hypothetical protein